jgi:hypothetical protein
MLFFPDRKAVLDLVDDEPAGVERFAPMRGAHTDPHCHIRERQAADAVNTQRMLDREARRGLRQDTLALLDRELLECLVLEPCDFPALVEIAHPALEAHVAAGAEISELAPRRLGVDGSMGEAEAHQPPATGGMNTTASPAASRRDQGANSLFTATFNCSRDSVKP